jgi:hypothetical protein
MRRYLLVSGVLFGLLTLVQVSRIAIETIGVARDPFFVLSTLISAGLTFWAWRVMRHGPTQARVVRAYPMLPRHEAEIRRLAHDLTVPRAAEKNDFYRRMGVARETWHLQESSLGHWVIVVTDMRDKPVSQAAKEFASSAKDFDRWFKEQIMLVTGLDPTVTPLGPPTEALFDSRQ